MNDLNSAIISRWFNAVRNAEPEYRDRVLEAFWAGQLDSKAWLINELNNIQLTDNQNIYIFGGWFGTLASMIMQNSDFNITKILSIDIDINCEKVFYNICEQHLDIINFIHADMNSYDYQWDYSPTIVINTSTEHVTQDVYNNWFDKIPFNTVIVAQGNDFYNCDEHVRCARDLEEFKMLNHVYNPLYEGSLPHDIYTRWMCIWKK